MTTALDRPATGPDGVTRYLIEEFAGLLPGDLVEYVVRDARRDLAGDVPAEALPEFTHRLAWRRLRNVLDGS